MAVELFVVIVGVFIGIQFSNWNDARLDQDRAQGYLERIQADLDADIANYRQRLKFWEDVSEYGAVALGHSNTGDMQGFTQWDMLLALFQASQMAEFYTTRSTYEELKSGGELGLILVAYELRQNSELMRVQINQARADSAMASNEHSFNSDYIPAIVVKVRQNDDLSAEESIRFTDYFRAMNRNQDNVLGQYDAGMLGENTPRSIKTFACQFIGRSKASQAAWEHTKGGYTDRYIEFIESTLETCE